MTDTPKLTRADLPRCVTCKWVDDIRGDTLVYCGHPQYGTLPIDIPIGPPEYYGCIYHSDYDGQEDGDE